MHPMAIVVVAMCDPSLSGERSQHLDLNQSVKDELSGSLFMRAMQARVNARNGFSSIIAALSFFIDKVCHGAEAASWC